MDNGYVVDVDRLSFRIVGTVCVIICIDLYPNRLAVALLYVTKIKNLIDISMVIYGFEC